MAKEVAAVTLLLALLQVSAAIPPDALRFEATQYFSIAVNSTCGDPPTLFEHQRTPGLFENCSLGDHEARLALDGDQNTWWQSANGEDPVAITFSLQQPSLALELVGIQLRIRSAPPVVFLVELQAGGASDFTLVQVYTTDLSLCDQYQGTPCSNFIAEVVDPVSMEEAAVICPLDTSGLGPISQIRMTAVGLQPTLNATSQYFSIQEATIYAWVAPDYHVTSLRAISVEGETGMNLDSQQTVDIGTSSGQFPDFDGRGYAVLQLDSTMQSMVQWVLPSLPKASRYQLLLRYANRGLSRVLSAVIMQGSLMQTVRFTFQSGCPPPCYTTAMSVFMNGSQLIQTVAELDLGVTPVTITMTLSSVDLLVDSFIFIPEEFYDASSLEESDRFTRDCDLTADSFDQETDIGRFCLQSAVQLSAQFYEATYACNCVSLGSVIGGVCEVYGGQCPCVTAAVGFVSINGRQCDFCPFHSYVTAQGCAACNCPDPLDDCGRTGAKGQCSCPALVVGRTCDQCMENAFGDPDVGCQQCSCNSTGTALCNSTTGFCNCRDGVTGVSCDMCMEGTFNFSSEGCTLCGCDNVGSEGETCDEEGQCQCKTGVGGLKCDGCLEGYFFFSLAGCTQCNCSGRTSACQQHPNVTSDPQELCDCPSPYVGDSCDACELGSFLSDQSGDCELCQCNNRSSSCLDGGGVCVNCSGDSAGDGCEVCAEGFYDADPSPFLSCLPCPCTTTTAFNTTCTADPQGSPICYCRPGHEGSRCDSCSEGFFGLPPDFRCTQCGCSGNIDPNVPGSCNTTTGQCLLCINNSTGDECELCAPGFFGNATEQNCQSCSCFPEGSNSTSVCDRGSGQCLCLPGVNGQSCSQCQPGYWNFQPGVGCEVCVCGVGSVNSECNVTTGACPCREGVGIVGRECTECDMGFFNFTAERCTPCGCGQGAIDISCDSDGECSCQPGVVGTKCDSCEPFHTNLSSSGCEPCGECEQTLRDQLIAAGGNLEVVVADVDRLEALHEADTTGLQEVQQTYNLISSNVSATRTYLETVESQLDAINVTASSTNTAVESTEDTVDVVVARTAMLQPYAEDVHSHVQNVANSMQDVFIQFGAVDQFIDATASQLQDQEQQAAGIAENITIVSSMHEENLSSEVAMAEAILVEVRSVADDAESALRLAEAQQGEVVRLTGAYDQIVEDIARIMENISETTQRHEAVRFQLEYALGVSAQLFRDADTIESTADLAAANLDAAERLLMEAQGMLIVARDDIKRTDSLLGEEPASSSFGSGMGLMSGMESGSGVESGQGELTPFPGPQSTILVGVAELGSVVLSLNETVMQCAVVVARAQEHAANLQQMAAEIQRVLEVSLEAGGEAVDAIRNYTDVITTLDQALNISMTTNTTLQALLMEFEALMVDQLQAQVSSLLTTSQQLLAEVETLNASLQALLPRVDEAVSQAEEAERQTLRAQNLATTLAQQVDELRFAAGTVISDVQFDLMSAESQREVVERVHLAINSSLPDLLSNVSLSQQQLQDTQQFILDADSMLDSANATTAAALDAHETRESLLANISQLSEENSQQLDALSASLSPLRNQLLLAQQAAASIDVALRFYGNSSLSYFIPAVADEESTSISLVFRPEETDGLMLYTEAGLGLQLTNGSVQFEFDLGGGATVVSTPGGLVQPDQWYQLFATREGTVGQLSVALLQGGAVSTVTQSSLPLSPTTLPLSTNDLVHLGGIPDSAGSVLVAENFVGCLDRVVINNAQLSLLVPVDPTSELATCGPRPPAESPRAFENGTWLQGGGSFVHLSTPLPSSQLRVEFAFRTFAEDGLLFQVFSLDTAQSVVVFLSGGRVAMEFSLSVMDLTHLETSQSYNNGEWYSVIAELDGRNGTLVVNSTEVLTEQSLSLVSSFSPAPQAYIGGLPPQLRTAVGSDLPSFAGCIQDFLLNGEAVNLEDNFDSYRASFGGCPAEVAAGVRFMGEGLAMFEDVEGNLSNISFAFRTTQLAAALLEVGTEPTPLSVSLYHTRVRVDYGSDSLESQGGLSNNTWHEVTISFEGSSLTLTVDGASVSTLPPSPPTLTSGTLTVGGTVNSSGVVVAESFRGCMDNLTIDGRAVDFNEAVALEGVALYGCRPETPAITVPVPPPPPPLPPPPSIRPNITVGLDGSPGSFLAFALVEEQVDTSYTITLEFQTVSEDSLLLYSQGSSGVFADYMALELSGGRLFHSFNLGSGRAYLLSSGRYNDGFLHMVELRRSSQEGVMVIDGGVEEVTDSSPGNFSELNINSGMLFVGGIPTALTSLSLLMPGDPVPRSTLACFHALAINSRFADLSMPEASVGAGECLETYTNTATFNDSGYIKLVDNYYAGTSFGFSLEFRTLQCSGLLFYVASSLFSDHVALEIINGSLRFIFDNGPGKVTVEYTPADSSELCNGQFHSVGAEKEGVRGTLTVDGSQTASEESPFTSFLSVNTNDPLFLGGVPDAVRVRYTVTTRSFTGCLGNVQLTDSEGDTETLLLAQASDAGGVVFHSCLV